MSQSKIHWSRREFIKTSSLAIASTPFLSNPYPHLIKPISYKPLKVLIFSKHLQFLNYSDMCDAAATIGFDGIDLTVRPKGHVEPQRVTQDLPRVTAAMKKVDFKPLSITTEVTDANNKLDRLVLKTASDLNFKYYRMGWLKYPQDASILKSIAVFKKQFQELAQLNKALELHGAYQNHSGKLMGASIWDLKQVLENISPAHCGCQYDIRHAQVESTNAWELGLRLIKDHIKTLVIKDFKWGNINGKPEIINTPLGQGMVDFDTYFPLLLKYNIDAPVTLHMEYDLGGAEHGHNKVTLNKKELFKHMKRDLNFLHSKWQQAHEKL